MSNKSSYYNSSYRKFGRSCFGCFFSLIGLLIMATVTVVLALLVL